MTKEHDITRLDWFLNDTIWIPTGLIGGCSLWDGVLSMDAVEKGMMTEGNPIWSTLIVAHPELFFWCKMLLSLAGCAALCYTVTVRPKLSYAAALFCLSAYSYIMYLHVVGRMAA